MIATNLTSICCVYKEKIVKNESCWRTYRPSKFRKLQHSNRIVENQLYSQTFIFQMLQLVGLVAIKTHIFCRELSFFVITPFKGSVRVTLSDPPCEDDNARFTTVPVKVRHLQFSTAEKHIFRCLHFSNYTDPLSID